MKILAERNVVNRQNLRDLFMIRIGIIVLMIVFLSNAITYAQSQTYQVGDVVNIDDLIVVVLGWDIPGGDQFHKPQEGNKFIVVDVLLVNKTTQAKSFSALMQMSLND